MNELQENLYYPSTWKVKMGGLNAQPNKHKLRKRSKGKKKKGRKVRMEDQSELQILRGQIFQEGPINK